MDQRRCCKLLVNCMLVMGYAQPAPVSGSPHPFKYRLALVVDEICVLRYDNEAGKGDHKHLGDREVPYNFTTLDQLVDDFWADVADLRGDNDDCGH